ncbi:hypothetical protein HI914_02040 [Erysiphe necator]|nr:hypothetical protein HI914_02040 [Erysiphe necator]
MKLRGNYPALKPRSESRHPIISCSETFDPAKDSLLCTRCGVKGYAKPACRNEALPYWERAYLNEKSAKCASRAVEIGTIMYKAAGHEDEDLAAANTVQVMAAKQSQGPMNFLEFARRFKADRNLLELMQVSQEVTRQLSVLEYEQSTRKAKGISREKKEVDTLPKTQGKKQTSEGSVETNIAGVYKRFLPLTHSDANAWKEAVIVKVLRNGKKQDIQLPLGMTHADQGSEINIISPMLQEKLGLKKGVNEASILTLGDERRGEKQLNFPMVRFLPAKEHKPVLHPRSPESLEDSGQGEIDTTDEESNEENSSDYEEVDESEVDDKEDVSREDF